MSHPPPPTSPLHVSIIGAGIGGLALAISLLRLSIPYTLYEAAPSYATVGAGIGLGPNALRAMTLISPRLRALYDGISSGNLTPGKDDVMSEALMAEPGFGDRRGWRATGWGGEGYVRTSAHRRALLDVMTGLVPGETVRFGKKARSVTQGAGGVRVVFEDGEVVETSCVVGCDGIKGAMRRDVLGGRFPDQVEPTYTGKYVYRAIVPMDEAMEILGRDVAGDAKMFMGHGVNFACYPISRGKELNVVAFKRDSGPWTHPLLTKDVSREAMYSDFDMVDKRLLRLLDWAKPVQWSLWHHATTPTFYNKRICLLGDSAHATSPHQAAGAGQCLEDAYVLSHLLASVNDPGDLEIAFKVYDSVRRPRSLKVVETSTEAGLIYNFIHPELQSDMHKIVENLNGRYLWLWEHDLEADMRKAKEQMLLLTRKLENVKSFEQIRVPAVQVS